MIRAHLFVTGRVQGVFFRANTVDKSKELGLTGWVKNLSDGRVEAVFEGPKETVEEMIEWCKHGPEGAEVYDIVVEYSDATGEFKDFFRR